MFCSNLKTNVSNLFTKNTLKCYIPKDSTQQEIFLTKYPEFDGRGIMIAIIDSGIDVSLEGLQKTSEGLPKIIECFDFTGAGDVDTSAIREMDSKNILIGLSGRKFKIPEKWINPSGKWHFGLKALFKPSMSPQKVSEKFPEIDCIVWFNGEKWCACIETFEGDSKNAKVLTNFRDDHEYGILTLEKLKIVYCITVKNDGNLLEIFTPYNYHGNFVTQIAAANFPKNPEQNGLAPGAQIISMCVLDPEKGHSIDPHNWQLLEKALLKCIEINVDIINFSLSSFTGSKEIINLVNEMVNKHNILLFKAAGNNGPFFYSPVEERCDKGVENSIFTIGAIFTSEIKKRGWNINTETPPAVLYPLSSRAPGAMEGRGLDYVAPGCAITKMPLFFPANYRLTHGTSYSTPNAAGAVSCLLSALKANSIQYSPALIKFALFKTAFVPENENRLGFGHGIIQIDAAFNYCKNYKGFKIPNYSATSNGITFVINEEDKLFQSCVVNLSEFINIENDTIEKWKLQLSPEGKNFIELSEITENNSFKIKFDPNKLEAGSLNYSEIMVMDSKIGSIFNIPVNIIYPLKITETQNARIQKEITLNYEKPYHILFQPFFESCRQCEVKIIALEKFVTNLCIQYIVDTVEVGNTHKMLKFHPKDCTQTYIIRIEEKFMTKIHEICINQMIGSSSNAKFILEFNFKNEVAP